jgi:hypothetical protein
LSPIGFGVAATIACSHPQTALASPAAPVITTTENPETRVLIVAALVSKLAVLWGVGIIVLAVGVILAVLGTTGRAVGGRRHYY